MQSYEKALIGGDTSLILSPDSEFFKFFGKTGLVKKTSDQFMKDLITALGLLLFIEGLLVAMFPSRIKNMLKSIEKIPNNKLRISGTFF